MDKTQIRAYFDTHIGRQPGTKIQYGHPSPRFWQPTRLDVEQVAAMRRPDRELVLYLHIPFCPQTDPPACGFCLFAREDFHGYPAVETYLEYLRRELQRYAAAFGGERLAAVYFGGGTPNILKPQDYARVMGWIRAEFELAPGAEVTLEGVPQLFTDERLAAMAEAGITRVSVGAQQLQDHLIEYSGRRQTAEQVFRAIERAHELEMVANVDLICGWFDQREDDLVADLERLVPLRPESIVVHPLTLAGPSHFSQERARLPSVDETCATFLRGRRFLEANGYWGSSYADYMLDDPPRGPAEVQYLLYYRDILRYDRLGVGYGANSLFAGTLERPAMTYRNIDRTQGYYEALDADELPTLEGFGFTAEDLRLLYVMKGLEGTPFLRASRYAADFGRDLGEDFADLWAVLEDMGWLEIIDADLYRLRDAAVFYTPMIQRCLAEERNAVLRRSAPSRHRSLPQVHGV